MAAPHRPLLRTLAIFFVFLVFFHLNQSPTSAQSSSSQFLSQLRTTVNELQKLIALVNNFSIIGIADIHTSSAIKDCVELLGLSVDELTWAISATSTASTTAKVRHDLTSWLSAALGNQNTCAESLSGTNTVLRSLVSNGLNTITGRIAQGLSEISGVSSTGSGGRRRRRLFGVRVGFPTWVGAGERRLLQSPTVDGMNVDAVVAADGSGDFLTVTEAIDAAPEKSERRIVIYVKEGVYEEIVEIKKSIWNIMLVGDGMGVTVITGGQNVVDGWTTYRSATFAVSGRGFIARDITFENTAGPEKHQAVALRSDSDLSVFYQCEIKGYQDTLYAHSLRQFYSACVISGTVDFIFGNAAAVFQSCLILARQPLPNQKNSVTAHGRQDPNQNTGFTIQFSNITANDDLAADTTSTSTYLGRPWKAYSRTVVMQSYIGDVIHPKGWLEWDGDFALSTLYYGEYANNGDGSSVTGRVTWPGFHVINSTSDADNFTVAKFIDGNSWLPATGVKYIASLTI